MMLFRTKSAIVAIGFCLLSLAGGILSPLIERWYSVRHTPIGLLALEQANDLFDAHEYGAVATLGRESLARKTDDNYGPEITLQAWRACARLKDPRGMEEFHRLMVEKYVNSSAAIDLSFEASCEEVSQGRLIDAERDLSSCISKQSLGGSAPFAAMLSRFCIASSESQSHKQL